MNNLSQECIETIYNQIDESVSGRNDIILGCKEALTNPTIYQSAGLMTVDEALRFAEWHKTLSRLEHIHATTTDLLNIFRNQKQEK